MKKQIKGVDINYHYEKLENGLEIVVIPLPFHTKYVTFTTKYGSNHLAFKKNGEKEFTQTPSGIAHFLEHKLFEQDGMDISQAFSLQEANINVFVVK